MRRCVPQSVGLRDEVTPELQCMFCSGSVGPGKVVKLGEELETERFQTEFWEESGALKQAAVLLCR